MTQVGEATTDDDELQQALLSLRQVPDPNLYRRVRAITQVPEERTRPAVGGPWPIGLWFGRVNQRIVASAVGLAIALVFIAFLTTSPVARATLGEIREMIGRIVLTVTDAMPDSSEAIPIDKEQIAIEKARDLVPFEFSLPTCLPEGYTGADTVGVIRPNETVAEVVSAQWHDGDGNFLELSMHAYSDVEPIQTIVGPDSLEVVWVNGTEAALVRGGWDSPSGEWRYQEETVTIIWVLSDVQYSLLSHGDRLSPHELIAVAESVR